MLFYFQQCAQKSHQVELNLIDFNHLGDWSSLFQNECDQPYWQQLQHFLREERARHVRIFPPEPLWFRAFELTPLKSVKVVILGQDPYHQPRQAHGLSFSVPNDVAIPPSLRNIFKELAADLSIPPPTHGNLTSWAKQGVLLLNAVLTVECGQANSHQNKGWEVFTDKIITHINNHQIGTVFMLWGRYAQQKRGLIDPDKHLILSSAHPSPLSAHRGFLGCRHFSQANEFLSQKGCAQIDWALDSTLASE